MSPRPLKVAIRNHFGKATALTRALEQGGHRIVGQDATADVLLIDVDTPRFGYRELIDQHKARGAKVLLYPHGANPTLDYDGLFEPYAPVDGNLVSAPGHAEVLRRMEYGTPVHVIGWSLSDVRPFRPCDEIRHVVFAPIHPVANGKFMAEYHRQANAEAFAELIKGPWRLTVRCLGTIEQNALWHVPGVNFVPGGNDLATLEIDSADVVVAGDGTFPSLSVARGVPTVIAGLEHAGKVAFPGEAPIAPARGDRYLDYLRYPFGASDGPLDEVMHAAARSEAPVADWKRRFIGAPLDPHAFSHLVERLVRNEEPPVAVDETRAFTAVAFVDELLERPELLATYARAIGPDDDATLVVWGPGLGEEELLAMTQRAVAAARVDDERLPDVLLLPLPSSDAADHLLAERAQALLSDWPPAGRLGALPRYGAADAPELIAATAARSSATTRS